MKLLIYTDGASRGNPGLASYGFTISEKQGTVLKKEGKYIGITTNNVAEYTAVYAALINAEKILGKVADVEVEIKADSKLVVEQLSGRFKIKSKNLIPIFIRIREIVLKFKSVIFCHIPRAQNSEADSLANKALDSL